MDQASVKHPTLFNRCDTSLTPKKSLWTRFFKRLEHQVIITQWFMMVYSKWCHVHLVKHHWQRSRRCDTIIKLWSVDTIRVAGIQYFGSMACWFSHRRCLRRSKEVGSPVTLYPKKLPTIVKRSYFRTYHCIINLSSNYRCFFGEPKRLVSHDNHTIYQVSHTNYQHLKIRNITISTLSNVVTKYTIKGIQIQLTPICARP